MADEEAGRREGLPVPRALEPVSEEAKMVRVEADMGSLLVGAHVWDASAGAWVKMQQPFLEVSGTITAHVDEIESKLDDVIAELDALNSLVPSVYDYISLTYTGDNLTGVVFKTGGSGGSTVSTLTLAYTGSRLDSVTKT